MGLKNFFSKMIDKAVSAVAGKTSVQRINMILKMVDLNIFSNLIICCRLPEIPKNGTYYLSSSELERLKSIFANYNANASRVTDSVISPIVNRQIKSNRSISNFFDAIETEIDNIPDKILYKNSNGLADIHEGLWKSVDNIIKLMYGLKDKLASKVSQNAIKDYVDAYVEKVLNAKPVQGIYWDDVLEWLSKILDQNVVYLGGLKTQLMKIKLPDEYITADKESEEGKAKIKDARKVFEGEYKALKGSLEKILGNLVKNYKTKKLDKSSEAGAFLSNLLNGKLFGIAIDKLTKEAVEKGKQVVSIEMASHKVKFMSALNSNAYKFMGFKLASKIKSQFQGYRDTVDFSMLIYKNKKEMIDGAINKLDKYIGLKNGKIKSALLNPSSDAAVSKVLTEVEESMTKLLSDLMKIFSAYEPQYARDVLQGMYEMNMQGIDSIEIKKLFEVVANNKKIMLFEEYAHEFYNLCKESSQSLQEVINPEKLYVNTNLLEMNAVKFSLKEGQKWVNRDYSGKKRLEDKAKGYMEKLKGIEKEIDTLNEDKIKCESARKNYLKYLKGNSNLLENYKSNTDLEKVSEEESKLETYKKEISENLTSITEYCDISVSNETELNQKRENFDKLVLKIEDIETTKSNIDTLKKQISKKSQYYGEELKIIKKLVNSKISDIQKSLNNVQNEFDGIVASMTKSLNTTRANYSKAKEAKKGLEGLKTGLEKNIGKDGNQRNILDKVYKEFSESEKKLTSSINEKIGAMEGFVDNDSKAKREVLLKIFNETPKDSETSKIVEKNNKCTKILEEIKALKEKCDSLSKANDEIKKLENLYNNTKKKFGKLQGDFSEINTILEDMKKSFENANARNEELAELKSEVVSAKNTALDKYKQDKKNKEKIYEICNEFDEFATSLLTELYDELEKLQTWSSEGLAAKEGEFAEKLNINAGESDKSGVLERLEKAKKCYDSVYKDVISRIDKLQALYTKTKKALNSVGEPGTWDSIVNWFKKS